MGHGPFQVRLADSWQRRSAQRVRSSATANAMASRSLACVGLAPAPKIRHVSMTVGKQRKRVEPERKRITLDLDSLKHPKTAKPLVDLLAHAELASPTLHEIRDLMAKRIADQDAASIKRGSAKRRPPRINFSITLSPAEFKQWLALAQEQGIPRDTLHREFSQWLRAFKGKELDAATAIAFADAIRDATMLLSLRFECPNCGEPSRLSYWSTKNLFEFVHSDNRKHARFRQIPILKPVVTPPDQRRRPSPGNRP